MQNILNHFKAISAIPHCSYDAIKLKDFLVEYAKSKGFSVIVDEANNILCFKGEPKVCLQCHYDMVCVGDAPKIDIYEEDGFLKARNSTLGADNGMGIAIMMDMMDKYTNLECLFTSDEEVGLIGANAFNTPLKSKYLLNLDSECEDEVIIGCAASFEINVSKKCKMIKTDKKYCYEISTKGFLGGHSGIDIAKGIRSAIPTLLRYIYKNGFDVASINGGERSNSISVGAKAIIFSDEKLENNQKDFDIKMIENDERLVFSSLDIAPFVGFKHGVFEYDEKLHMPKYSANFSFIHTKGDEIGALFYARSDDESMLDDFETYIKAVFVGFDVMPKDKDKPWESVESEFSNIVLKCLKTHNPKAHLASVHAGLECGVIKAKQPHLMCASIGPNIFYPHSVNEKCEIKSVGLIKNVVDDLLSIVCK